PQPAIPTCLENDAQGTRECRAVPRRAPGARALFGRPGPEIHARCLLRFGWHLEVLLRLEAEARGVERRREALDVRVVLAHGVVVAHPLDRDPVLRPRELVRQPGEMLIRLEVGIL